MYYPADMTKEDIEAFELDMAELTLREEEEEANWLLQEAANDAQMEEIFSDWVDMVADLVGVPARIAA
jgi:hypothetical protein